MRQDERVPFDLALQRARPSAYPPGEFIGQESFMRASEILTLAVRAGVGPGVPVLDLCCGVAGPGRLVARELGCTYLGVDQSRSAIEIAQARATGLPCRFEVRRIPPVPAGPFGVVLLLETLLAFRDKDTLLRQVSSVLEPGGRLAFTLEEGQPLTPAERDAMPDAETVWPTPLADVVASCARAGLSLRWHEECSSSHLDVVESLTDAFAAEASGIAAEIGDRAVDELLAAHRLWSDWLRRGRVRKFAVVAEKA